MSKARPHLDSSAAGIRRFVESLSQCEHVLSVWLGGSRSPISPKNPHAGSDWDLQVVTGTVVKKEDLPNPTEQGVYGDIFPRQAPSRYAVQIWPEDTHGVFA